MKGSYLRNGKYARCSRFSKACIKLLSKKNFLINSSTRTYLILFMKLSLIRKSQGMIIKQWRIFPSTWFGCLSFSGACEQTFEPWLKGWTLLHTQQCCNKTFYVLFVVSEMSKMKMKKKWTSANNKVSQFRTYSILLSLNGLMTSMTWLLCEAALAP